jgi:hypothetical protein
LKTAVMRSNQKDDRLTLGNLQEIMSRSSYQHAGSV